MHSIEHLSGQLRSLRLNSLSQSAGNLIAQAEENELSYLQFAQQLFDHELQCRNHKRIEINRRKAGFPVEKQLEEFDYRAQSSISKRQVNQLLDFGFIDERDNLIFIGPPGVGKTHLAIGIGQKAIQAGYKVMFTTALGLVETLEMAEIKGELKKRLNQISKYDLVIIDELGYLPMSQQSNHNLFQLINTLYEFRSIILTTNKEFTQWGEFFIDENVAVPIVDRLIHHSKIYMLGGESYRLRQKNSG
jgi:DNA replication protein DnaC